MSFESAQVAGLLCHTMGPRDAPLTVVFFHGFGAPGDDLVPLGPEMARLRPGLASTTRWIFPEAPHALLGAGPGRAWWDIDIPRLQALQLRDEPALEVMRNEEPAGMSEAREAVLALVASLRRTAPANAKFALGGFSQGAMLSTDVALHLDQAPDALVLFSGSLLNAPKWRQLAPARRGLPVLQSHGQEDPILPFRDAERLRDLLRDAGLGVEFLSFRGGHTIPHAALERGAALLGSLGG